MRPYHKYVFDSQGRRFVGAFEEMYQQEEVEEYDSWFQEDMRELRKQFSLAILNRYNFSNILDAGCGKGAFSHLLKKANNRVVGIDSSRTAIDKARAKYPDIDFRVLDAENITSLGEVFDLVVIMELLSYVERWREVISAASTMTNFLYVTLYVPPNPIGYVKSFDELRSVVESHFSVETELVYDREHLCLLAKSLPLHLKGSCTL